MNSYSKAISRNEVIYFFRGKGDYFSPDRDREGEHDFSFTSFNIFSFCKEIGEGKFYEQLNKDLLKYCRTMNFTIEDLNIIVAIIWTYYYFKNEENRFVNEWKIDGEIIDWIRKAHSKFELNNTEIRKINSMIQQLSDRFGFRLI